MAQLSYASRLQFSSYSLNTGVSGFADAGRVYVMVSHGGWHITAAVCGLAC
jgi:hypothetical protein